MQNFSSPQRQIPLLADSGSPAQPHCGLAAATELCIFPNVTHKHVILQTSSFRRSTGREHSHWAWNHLMCYFPLVKHTTKVVTYSIQPKLQNKFQAPSHTGPVYSRTEAWIHPSCHHEHMLTRSIHRTYTEQGIKPFENTRTIYQPNRWADHPKSARFVTWNM